MVFRKGHTNTHIVVSILDVALDPRVIVVVLLWSHASDSNCDTMTTSVEYK